MSFYQGLAFWQVYKSIKTNKIKKCLKIICLTIQSNILLLKKNTKNLLQHFWLWNKQLSLIFIKLFLFLLLSKASSAAIPLDNYDTKGVQYYQQ